MLSKDDLFVNEYAITIANILSPSFPTHLHHPTNTTNTISSHLHPPTPPPLSLRQAETLLCNLEAGLVHAAGPHADVSGLGMGPTPGAKHNQQHNQQHSHNSSNHSSHQNLSNQELVPTGTAPTTPSHGTGHRNSTILSAFPVLDLAHSNLSWTIKFEMCRRKLVARRLQAVVRSFLNHTSVVVPRGVRGMLRPGYLRGVRGIRTRQVG